MVMGLGCCLVVRLGVSGGEMEFEGWERGAVVV
jgi:hypothetical protein